MPKAKKSEESSDSDSGPEDRNPPASKKSKSASTVEKKEEKNEWTLEKLRKVRINEFRGRKSVDIREHYEKDGEILPGKKGIALSLSQWNKLLEYADEITAAMKE